MKTLKYILLGIFILHFIFSCNSQTLGTKNSKEIVLQSNGNSNKAQLFASKEIISNRLKTLQINNFEIDQKNENSQLIVKLKDSLDLQMLSNVLTAKGEVDFDLALARQEVIAQLTKHDPKTILARNASISDILSLLEPASSTSIASPVIGRIDLNDTNRVSNCLNTNAVKNLFTDGIQFIWAKSVDKQNKLELYAISSQNSISGKTIKEVSVVKSASNKAEISILFNAEGTIKWKNLTRINIGKAVAIVIDDKVYSAPIIQSEIPNGNCIITGNYTTQEAKCIVAVIQNGTLPLSFKLIK